jgi:hypothetical protein
MGFDAAWERVRNITGWKKYKDLAGFLGLTAQTVSDTKERGSFPLEWAFKISQVYGSSTDWIIKGRGYDEHMVGADASKGADIVNEKHIDYRPLDALDWAYLNDWHKLSDAGRMRVWALVKEELKKEKEG